MAFSPFLQNGLLCLGLLHDLFGLAIGQFIGVFFNVATFQAFAVDDTADGLAIQNFHFTHFNLAGNGGRGQIQSNINAKQRFIIASPFGLFQPFINVRANALYFSGRHGLKVIAFRIQNDGFGVTFFIKFFNKGVLFSINNANAFF